MTFSHYAKVKNNLIVKNKFGREVRVINVLLDGQEKPIWINKLEQFSEIKPGQTISVVVGTKGSLTILDDPAPTTAGVASSMNEVSNRSNGHSNGSNTSNTQTYSQRNRNDHSSPSNHQEDIEDLIHDVPMLSDLDKKKVARFIDQQARLYRYTVDTVAKQFPELVGVDDRGIRSIALSLLINTNHMINRNL